MICKKQQQKKSVNYQRKKLTFLITQNKKHTNHFQKSIKTEKSENKKLGKCKLLYVTEQEIVKKNKKKYW